MTYTAIKNQLDTEKEYKQNQYKPYYGHMHIYSLHKEEGHFLESKQRCLNRVAIPL